jgi:hypothetical protein
VSRERWGSCAWFRGYPQTRRPATDTDEVAPIPTAYKDSAGDVLDVCLNGCKVVRQGIAVFSAQVQVGQKLREIRFLLRGIDDSIGEFRRVRGRKETHRN